MIASETPYSRPWALIPRVFMAVLIAGIAGTLLDWRPGAYIAIAGLTGTIAAHGVIGLAAYRRVMRRPWPKVPALTDDDW